MFASTIAVWLSLGVLAVASIPLFRSLGRHPLPPGPNWSLSPGGRQKTPSGQPPWQTYANWKNVFGPVICLHGIGRLVIVLNSVEGAVELLDKRKNFACKPRWPMAELLGRQHNVGFQYYGDRLKICRRFIHGSLNMKAVTTRWHALLETRTQRLLSDLVTSPNDCYINVHRNIESFVTVLTYGFEANENYLNLVKEVMSQTSIALQPGRWLVNFFPILVYIPAWFPGAGFQRWARNAKELFFRMTRTPFNQVKAEMAEGIAKPSFVSSTLENLGDNCTEEDQEILMSTAGSLFSAGTETGSIHLISTILTFLLLIARHPEVQERAFQEISSVVKNDRLPGLDDLDSLPYIDAIIQEVHRFNPAIPLVTHSPMTEDVYMGYRIPKKAWIMANVWAILHDDSKYPDPHKFLPERFLPSVGDAPRDPRTLVFGFGRRICPGAHLANTLIYLIVVRLLAGFQVGPEIGPDGRACFPPLEFATGLVPMPKPFRCTITPRPNTTSFPRNL